MLAKGRSVVHGYEVFFQPNALLEKADVLTALHRSIHSMHKTTAVYALHDEDCRISSRNVSFFPIKHLVGIKDAL